MPSFWCRLSKIVAAIFLSDSQPAARQSIFGSENAFEAVNQQTELSSFKVQEGEPRFTHGNPYALVWDQPHHILASETLAVPLLIHAQPHQAPVIY